MIKVKISSGQIKKSFYMRLAFAAVFAIFAVFVYSGSRNEFVLSLIAAIAFAASAIEIYFRGYRKLGTKKYLEYNVDPKKRMAAGAILGLAVLIVFYILFPDRPDMVITIAVIYIVLAYFRNKRFKQLAEK